MTGAIILAAGDSSRFGRPKQLILFEGKSLLRRIINATHEADCSPIVVVVGGDGEKLVRELRSSTVTWVENKSWKVGIGSSIRTGLRHLLENAPCAEATVLLVCDQPFVDANTIRSLIALRETTKKEIIASKYAKTLGVPALFDRSFFHELLSLDDTAGAKSIILRNRERIAEFPFPNGHIDIDSWSDYEALTRSVPNTPDDRSSSAKESPEGTEETARER